MSVTVTGARGQHGTVGWALLAEAWEDTASILPTSMSIIPVSFQCHPGILPSSLLIILASSQKIPVSS